MQNRRIIDTAFNQAGVTPTIAVETDSILAMYSHVCHGGLATVVPHSFLILFKRHPGLVAIPLIPLLSRQIGLLTLKRDPKSPLGACPRIAIVARARLIETDFSII
ncbi:MAG: LysR family transcriptional regulator substrate-binding protein [Methylococcales bacterium]